MRLGEIVETNTTTIVAESEALHQMPPLGSLCQIHVRPDCTIFAVVAFGRTGGVDPSRRAVRRGSDTTSDAAVYEQHPELTRVLRTEFSATLAGWSDGRRTWQQIPSQPPPLHYSVHSCNRETIEQFSDHLTYFRLLLASQGQLPGDQLLAANVRDVFRTRGNDSVWLERAAREVARLLRNDYERMMNALLAIEP